MKRFIPGIFTAAVLLLAPAAAFAASNDAVTHFTQDTLTVLISLAGVAAALFLIRGGYLYTTSSGKPEALQEAKRTIRLALIGLAIVIGASVFSSFLNAAFYQSGPSTPGAGFNIHPIQPAASPPLTQVLLDAISGFLRNIVQSATKPILDGIVSFLTNTPSLVSNSVIFNFWLVMVGITDSLFALVIALLGFHVMSASTFGFDDIPLKEMFPRIGLAFLAANTSIFVIDWVISLCQLLIHAVLSSSGGLGQAWLVDAFNPAVLLNGDTGLITLIMLAVFVVLAIVLLLFYIGRLMLLALGAVMSPLLCLLWLVPRFNGFAESSITAYIVIVFSIFVHVVIIQLGSAFLAVPGQTGTNPFISVLVGVALMGLLLKSTSMIMHLALMSQSTNTFRRMGRAVLNTISSTAGKPSPRKAA